MGTPLQFPVHDVSDLVSLLPSFVSWWGDFVVFRKEQLISGLKNLSFRN
jgi:hypothetical protein